VGRQLLQSHSLEPTFFHLKEFSKGKIKSKKVYKAGLLLLFAKLGEKLRNSQMEFVRALQAGEKKKALG